MTLTQGHLLSGRYRLDEAIASGGMGTVWRATDELLGRLVAIKVLHAGGSVAGSTSAGEDFRERFRAEARSSAALSHPNIATVFDFGDDDEHPFLVMELVEGRSLADVVAERGALPADEVAAILGQAALALQVAHSAGVIHRDVKPANIMLTPGGVVKLTDFGIARVAAGAGLTRTGEVLGTPHYLSPEQTEGRPATAASDLYALGVVGHELLTGKRPFDGESMVATALAHVTQPAPVLPDTVPEPLRGAVMAALAKDPAQRPASAGDLAATIGMPVGPVTPLTGFEPRERREPAELLSNADPADPADASPAAQHPATAILPATGGPTPTSAATGTPTGSSAARTTEPRKRRPWWLVPVGASAGVLAIVAAALALGGPGDSQRPDQRSTAPVTTPAATTTTTPATRAATTPATISPAPAAKPSDTGKGQGKGGKKK